MRYADAAAFRMALEQRLKTIAAGDGARVARDRKRIAFDRLLARLDATAPDQWLLKGGFALELRLRDRARATKDVDLEWRTDEDELLDALIDAVEHDPGDYFAFEVARTGPPPERLGGTHRFHVSVSLAGRPFEQRFALDVAPRSSLDAGPVRLTTPDLLAFAGVDPVTLAAIPHFALRVRHDTSRAQAALALGPPPLATYFERLVDFAQAAQWGRRSVSRVDAAGTRSRTALAAPSGRVSGRVGSASLEVLRPG